MTTACHPRQVASHGVRTRIADPARATVVVAEQPENSHWVLLMIAGVSGVDRVVARTPWDVISRGPWRPLISPWPWRGLLYLATTPVVGIVWVISAWPLGPLAGVPLNVLERWRLRIVDRRPALTPFREPSAGGVAPWLRTRIAEGATWQALGYGVLLIPLAMLDFVVAGVFLVMPVAIVVSGFLGEGRLSGDRVQVLGCLGIDGGGFPDGVLALVLGVILFAVGTHPLLLFVSGRVGFARLLLVGDREQRMDRRIRELESSRSRVLNGFEIERARIERDLHDGVQARLTALILTTGVLSAQTRNREPGVSLLADQIRGEAVSALRELRELVNGIYPAALREGGLRTALPELVDGHPLPIRLGVDLPGRVDERIESTVYFAVCEALSNVVKHSGASRAEISVTHDGSRLRVDVTDHGRGGADARRGSGLAGMRDRVEAVGGTLRLSSPVGGPTVITMEVECGL